MRSTRRLVLLIALLLAAPLAASACPVWDPLGFICVDDPEQCDWWEAVEGQCCTPALAEAGFCEMPEIDPGVIAIDPCVFTDSCLEIDPDLFDVPGLLCLIEPEACGPSVEPDFVFAGMETFKVKGAGKLRDVTTIGVEFGPFVFESEDETAAYYSGVWAEVGSSGRKYRFVFDDPSESALEGKVADGAASVAGGPMSVEFTRPPKVILKVAPDGESAVLKIRAKGIGGASKVKYKAKLEGAPVAPVPAL